MDYFFNFDLSSLTHLNQDIYKTIIYNLRQFFMMCIAYCTLLHKG